MQRVSILGLIFYAASLAAFGAGIDGKWVHEMQVGDADGKTYTHTTTLFLNNENGVLTGKMVQVSAAPWMKDLTGRELNITDGKVEGEKFSFKVTHDTKTGQRTAVYEGTIEGDRLKGIIKYRGIGMTRPFDAKRTD